MGWSRRTARGHGGLDLGALPASFDVAPVGAAWFVIGPTGAYVVLENDDSPETARALGRLAATIRSVLAERMAWVPFVHPLLVDERTFTVAHATVVPRDLLIEVITEGRTTLERETFDCIHDLVANGVLNGLEAVAPAPADARMEECATFAPPTASTWLSTN